MNQFDNPNGIELYYKNGQLQEKRKYCYNGIKHGLWEYFDEKGNLTKTE